MSALGTGSSYAVEGMMNQYHYNKVFTQRLIPKLIDWFK